MTFSKIGRLVTAVAASAALGLGMTACGGGTIGFMWVLGTYYNQITGFKIDDYTGNLTQIPGSPFSSGGSNPQMLVVKPGGRFVYVLNSGTGEVGLPGTPGYVAGTGSSVEEFAVGGNGVLTPQQTFSSQGTHPVYLSFDSSGNYLFVLDKYAPDYNAVSNPNGSLTAFVVASDTGRLTLVPNTTILNPNGTPTTFFEVGASPVMTKVGSNGCVYTLSADSIFPYSVSPSNGQLVPTTTGPQQIIPSGNGVINNPINLTSINPGGGSAGSFVYLTDGANNTIYSYTAQTGCTLSPIPSSQETNIEPNAVPVNSLTSNNGSYLYVLNQIPSSTTAKRAASISAYTISGQGVLQQLSTDPGNNPYATGSGPTCLVEDPSNQYIYTSNFNDGTVTGKVFQSQFGFLSDLTHGSTFPVSQNPSCLAVSGNL